ncbi:MAG TPA: response regulator [Candidatus Dormibacteraeota bacterium]|nr:response regulator [Candidatus Dormibacteraeota bacterium]
MAARQLILIVEDDPASRLLATATLEDDGYEVLDAGSAEEAIPMIERRAPDLILMDIQLPGMDGLELTRKLKSEAATATIPVVALTAHTMPLHERAAVAAGCAAFLAKPVSPAILSAEVRARLENPEASR